MSAETGSIDLLLLAAGFGVRMGSMGAGRPKILVPILDDISLIEITLGEAISTERFRQIVLVVSEVDDQTMPYLRARGIAADRVAVLKREPGDVFGPIGSIIRGLEMAQSARLMIGNGDTIFHRAALHACADAIARQDDVVLCASPALNRQLEDDVVLQLNGGRILSAVKRGSGGLGAENHLISAGLIGFSGESNLARLRSILADIQQAPSVRERAWHSLLALLAEDEGGAAAPLVIDSAYWWEFDDFSDIAAFRQGGTTAFAHYAVRRGGVRHAGE